MDTCKLQYEDLPSYNIPGNEAIQMLPPDGLAPLPPVTYYPHEERKIKKSSGLAAATATK